MKKILVTGGAGYIGSKICYDLTDLGYKVFIVDNLITGHKKLINKRAKFYLCDILDRKQLNEIIKKNHITDIIHLAASLDVEESSKNPLKYFINNAEGTENLLKASVNNNVKNFIFSSTCAVYGNIKAKSVNEKSPTEPISYYGKTKLLCELLIKDYSFKYKLSSTILRYFNVGGADELLRTGCLNNNGQLLKKLAQLFIKKNKATFEVFGNDYPTLDGTCVRDFIHVSNLSKIHIYFLKNRNKKNLILNCGYGKGYSIIQIIRAFEEIYKKKINIVYKKRRVGDIDYIKSNTSFLKNNFSNLNINKDLNEIIKSTVEWEKSL
jgi:UDP-glucose 4-epimerase